MDKKPSNQNVNKTLLVSNAETYLLLKHLVESKKRAIAPSVARALVNFFVVIGKSLSSNLLLETYFLTFLEIIY